MKRGGGQVASAVAFTTEKPRIRVAVVCRPDAGFFCNAGCRWRRGRCPQRGRETRRRALRGGAGVNKCRTVSTPAASADAVWVRRVAAREDFWPSDFSYWSEIHDLHQKLSSIHVVDAMPRFWECSPWTSLTTCSQAQAQESEARKQRLLY